ncbi:hypothetical protein HK100_007764 [Physocladia obscura]|uniref:Major facilitator superfamily (MFS) profile domain-containing protein n=1 Tax=Physocladia obscura TaxID=109957 RepID=A0AAD5T4J8_9FUNG|nr:hypothetical protein HK100_007764 [Physocladia obscura]
MSEKAPVVNPEQILADEAEVNRVMRKVDWHVLPILCGFYFFQAIDKGNIGLAQLGGITTDTQTTTGALFNGAVAMFYVGYILLELPSNLILQRVSPKFWVSFIGLAWGVCVLLVGFAKSAVALYLGRFFLGVFEAGILPASLLITATWYPKSEHAFKSAIWFSASSVGSALGGIISYLIQTYLTGGSFHTWSYLMFIEGGATVLWGILSFVICPDVPEKASFLSDAERLIVVNRLKADHSQTSLAFNRGQFIEAFKDYKTWLLAIIYFCWQTVNASFSTFSPSIIKGLGFSSLNAQLLTSPFAVINFFLQLAISRYSDSRNSRAVPLAGSALLAVVGYLIIIFFSPTDVGGRWALYVLFAFTCFNPGSLPLILAWTTNLIVGHTKRTVSVTIVVLASAFGGLAGSFVYEASDAPRYIVGHTSNMILVIVGLTTVVGLALLVRRENQRRDAVAAENGIPKIILAKDLADGIFAENFTDLDPSFRYQKMMLPPVLITIIAYATIAAATPDSFGAYLPETVLVFGNWITILVGSVVLLLGIGLTLFGGSPRFLALYANGFLVISTLCTLITWNGFIGVFMCCKKPGLLFIYAPFFGHMKACAFYGMLTGLEFLSLQSGSLFPDASFIGRQLFIAPFALVPVIIAYYHPKYMLCVMSGLAAPFVVALAIDLLFAQTGLFQGVASFMSAGESGATAAAAYVLTFVGAILVGIAMVSGIVAGWLQYRAGVKVWGKTSVGGVSGADCMVSRNP